MGPIDKIVFLEPKKMEGSGTPLNPFSVGRKNAVVHFQSVSDAANALATLHNFEIDGVQVPAFFFFLLSAQPCLLLPPPPSRCHHLLHLGPLSPLLFLSDAPSGSHQFLARSGEGRRAARFGGAGAGEQLRLVVLC